MNNVSHPCPLCCSVYMVETETGWICPVCGAVMDLEGVEAPDDE